MAPKMSDYQKQLRRTDILDAAEEVFTERGYEHTTMKDIYESVGLSRGGLYQYFSNKQEVFETLIGDKLEEIHDRTSAALEEGEDPWNLLKERLFGEEKQPREKNDPLAPVILEFFVTGRNDLSISSFAKERYRLGVQMYANIIKKGAETGRFTPRFAPPVLARSIVAFTDGIAVDTALAGKEVRKKEQSELIYDTIIHMLKVQ
ncbi:TetR/AcrR family transcriptional regulator [Salimicrobium flavidum]|uniref:Transcriptional regulator, TetR family n=1 Tax=Salimicrobium flavidum TaxID=570947 RepID=A0A1N7J9N3_9BACI|nr:TetR/AcrR family transcriptional regulator [Salimicrobium flavidum]SIS45971.1 transcriptional regulator, TetR family [Salimicrobium flavidum]